MSIAPPSPQLEPAAPRSAHTLGYAAALPDPAIVGPSEFDVELESERTRWIRRRFLWFCGVNVVLVVGFYAAFADDVHAAPPLAKVFNVLDLALVGGGYAAAFVYVWRARLTLRQLLRLGLYLAAVLPALSIVFTRADYSLNPSAYDFWGRIADPGTRWALTSPTSIWIFFSIACLLIPWSAREALGPAAALLGANAAVILVDALLTIRQPMGRYLALGALAASPLAVLPGLAWRWWRYARFRKFFPVFFESSGYRKLQVELTGARRLHESTLPPPNLHATGAARLAYAYEPMRQIGGDVLYVHPNGRADADRLCVVLIDVNGHGIPAALMANRLIGETQRLFAEDPDAPPDRILCALNRYVRLTMADEGVFATALVACLDTANDVLTYANGGHPPALLRRADGSIARLDGGTYLLGCYDGDDYCPAAESVPFHAGDALLAYTDGATEARDAATGGMVTIDGLHRLLADLAPAAPPDRWPAGLLQRVVNHRRAPAADDTLIVSLYRPPV